MNRVKESLLDGSAWVVGAVIIGTETAWKRLLSLVLPVPFWLYWLTLFVVYLFGLSVGWSQTKATLHREAVKAGAAQWVVDEDGKVKFRWRE